jgi:hypothetical protein
MWFQFICPVIFPCIFQGGAVSQPKFKNFLLKGGSVERTELGPCFPQSGFGPYVLERKKVVNAVFNAIENQLKLDKQSTGVYLSGCRGMGKTCDLRLIAEEFNVEGWEVYWFESVSLITPGDGLEIRSYAKQCLGMALKASNVVGNPVTLHQI